MESMLDILSYVGWVLLAITILVFVHEMGHFLTAKLFKMRVDRFSIGFPPKIVSKQVGETEYVIGATPLGGYVKIAGMVDESLDTDFQEEPEPWEFRSKPVWQRIVVITAGVIFNMILAAVIFAGIKYAYGDTQPVASEDGSVFVADSSLAYTIGLRTGDRILAISGEPYDPYGGLQSMESLLADSLTITVDRDGQELTLSGPDDIMTQLSRAGSFGIDTTPSVVGEVMPDSPAEEAGLQPGDRIVAIDGEPVPFWIQMTQSIRATEGEPLTLTWVRPGDDPIAADSSNLYTATVAPREDTASGQYLVGITWALRQTEYGFSEAIAGGITDTWVNTKLVATNLKRVFTGRENFRENIGGPVMVAVVTKQAADAGARQFWFIVAMLSITLAIVNILPIPALDGGHLVFLIYEGITRREPSLKVRMVLQQVGMVLLLTLMVFLIFNDILRL